MLNRDAVDVLAFDRYGNYVTQTLLSVYMEVLSGKRGGDLDQFHRVADKLRQVPYLKSRQQPFSAYSTSTVCAN